MSTATDFLEAIENGAAPEAVARIVAGSGGRLYAAPERQAIQLEGCGGVVVMNVPVGSDVLSAVEALSARN
jgi:hypothetical protein